MTKGGRLPAISVDTEATIKDLYLNQRLSSLDISQRLGITLRVVTYAIARMNIARSFKEASEIAKKNGKLPLRGNKSHAWRGGRHIQDGYVMLYAPDHPRAILKRLYVAEHILVWEKSHQRRLPYNWAVHHVNGIKTDNRPENLVAYPRHKHDQLLPHIGRRIRNLELEIDLLKKALSDHQALFVISGS